jgi:hypothetical protein
VLHTVLYFARSVLHSYLSVLTLYMTLTRITQVKILRKAKIAESNLFKREEMVEKMAFVHMIDC